MRGKWMSRCIEVSLRGFFPLLSSVHDSGVGELLIWLMCAFDGGPRSIFSNATEYVYINSSRAVTLKLDHTILFLQT